LRSQKLREDTRASDASPPQRPPRKLCRGTALASDTMYGSD
jgi:hypothetical protein